MTTTRAVNYALYQAGWLACIFGAAWRHETAGVAGAVGLILTHLWLTRERGLEIRLLALATAVGVIVESLQMALATYEATSALLPPPGPPAWLIVLWAQFATTFRYCLAAIIRSPLRAALFGGLGGPIAFVAADRLGALELLPPASAGLVRIALAWTVALLLFSRATRRWSSGEPATYRQTLRGL